MVEWTGKHLPLVSLSNENIELWSTWVSAQNPQEDGGKRWISHSKSHVRSLWTFVMFSMMTNLIKWRDWHVDEPRAGNWRAGLGSICPLRRPRIEFGTHRSHIGKMCWNNFNKESKRQATGSGNPDKQWRNPFSVGVRAVGNEMARMWIRQQKDSEWRIKAEATLESGKGSCDKESAKKMSPF